MTAIEAVPLDVEVRRSRTPAVLKVLVRRRQGQIGVVLLAAILLVIAFGPVFAPYGQSELRTGVPFAPLSRDHLLGTDNLGRDVFSRFLFGGRQVILIPLVSVVLATLVGATLGMAASLRGGWLDATVSRLFDVLLTLPSLLLGLILISSLGTSTTVLVFVTVVLFMPRMGRNVRAASQVVTATDYVASAKARGESLRFIVTREITPNVVTPIIANFTSYLSYAVVFAASLSFLGLGDQPPSSSWGLMVAQSRAFLVVSPAATVAPAVGIATISVATYLIGDVLLEHLNRLDGRGGESL